LGSIRAKEAAVSHAADDRRRRGCPRSGFTLVELLVVIGIVALLVGLLMPVLAGVADRGRDIQCQANLRGIMQAMHGYAAEHDGQFPWGYVNNRMAPGTWSPAPGSSDEEAVCWAALVAQYWNKSVPPAVGTAGETIGDVQRHFTPALQCPDAMQYRDHEVSYAMSLVAGASPYIDVHLAGGNPPPLGALLRPVRQHQFGKDTAVLWDTALVVGTEYEPQVRMGLDIDGQRIWQGARSPQLRFLSARDPFQAVSGGTFAHNRPLELNLPGWTYRNRETISESDFWTYQGNLRFRHRKNTACNVAFADGSVRQFTAKMNPDRSVRSHDALRRYFMLKWPPGVPPDPSLPH
jgi:prepilin-type N-terminal cleavage/methylation domain-containing protein/prepilin-type processing-associated H-X9-DG protein